MVYNKVKVLVVDDSMIARKYLTRIFEDSGKIDVIGSAEDGIEALEKIKKLKPEVVTLDIEMPKLNGIEVLKRIMNTNPLPVIMVSTLTTDGASSTLEALRIGAFDYIPKTDVLSFKLQNRFIKDLLIKKIIEARQYKFKIAKHYAKINVLKKQRNIIKKRDIDIIAIAASTGGPMALEEVFKNFPKVDEPVLIVQHMPKTFTTVFAKSLNNVASIIIKEAENGDELKGGNGYLAPGGKQMSIKKDGLKYFIDISDKPETIYIPNANIMFISVAEYFRDKSLCVIMTGMGDDGYLGLKQIHDLGGTIIAQSKESCVVWGMPRKPTENNLVDIVSDLHNIAPNISKILGV